MSQKQAHRLRPVNVMYADQAARIEAQYHRGDLIALRNRMRLGQKVLAVHEVMDGKICTEKKDVEAVVVGIYPWFVRVRFRGARTACYRCLTYAQILTEGRLIG